MAFTLPKLPYALGALAPHISREALEYHHGKHHAAYVDKLNELVRDTKIAAMKLEDILVQAEPGALLNNAAQHFNHSIYWKSLKTNGGGEPRGALADAIKDAFGDFSKFRDKFTQTAVGHFGSGWTWRVKKKDGALAIKAMHDAGTPLRLGMTPLMTCDVWEHAYYIDYRSARPRYVEAFLKIINWDFAAANLK